MPQRHSWGVREPRRFTEGAKGVQLTEASYQAWDEERKVFVDELLL
ncbi:hypothetical protein [Halorussus halophilus]|nr:hypothetical protein [Halorussus halophilus]